MRTAHAVALAACLGAASSALAEDSPASVAQLSEPLGFSTKDGRSLWFTALFGVQSRAAYFGSDDSEVSPAFSISPVHLSFGRVQLGSPAFKSDPQARDLGFGLRGSFNFIGARKAGDHDDLDGLEDVDPTLELGVGLGYTGQVAEAYGDLRYGLGGSDGWVGELGANVVMRPSDRFAVRVGPRLLYGSDNYVDTYFGVSDTESAESGLDAFAPSGGLVSAGVEMSASYRLGERWWLEGRARYDRYQEDAADSPIVERGSSEATSVRIGLRRGFVLDF